MAVEILIPFALDSKGALAVTSDLDRMANQHVRSLIATNPGERVMLADYGVPLAETVFEPNNNLAPTLAEQIRQQLTKWEPSLTITGLTPKLGTEGQGIVDIEVDFTRLDSTDIPPVSSPKLLNASISVGGTVTGGS